MWIKQNQCSTFSNSNENKMLCFSFCFFLLAKLGCIVLQAIKNPPEASLHYPNELKFLEVGEFYMT